MARRVPVNIYDSSIYKLSLDAFGALPPTYGLRRGSLPIGGSHSPSRPHSIGRYEHPVRPRKKRRKELEDLPEYQNKSHPLYGPVHGRFKVGLRTSLANPAASSTPARLAI
jgi:hypothetical protein